MDVAVNHLRIYRDVLSLMRRWPAFRSFLSELPLLCTLFFPPPVMVGSPTMWGILLSHGTVEATRFQKSIISRTREVSLSYLNVSSSLPSNLWGNSLVSECLSTSGFNPQFGLYTLGSIQGPPICVSLPYVLYTECHSHCLRDMWLDAGADTPGPLTFTTFPLNHNVHPCETRPNAHHIWSHLLPNCSRDTHCERTRRRWTLPFSPR